MAQFFQKGPAPFQSDQPPLREVKADFCNTGVSRGLAKPRTEPTTVFEAGLNDLSDMVSGIRSSKGLKVHTS